MCTYSLVVKDWQHPTWPTAEPGITVSPNAMPWGMIQADPKLAQQMLDILQRLEAIDKKLGNIECLCTDKTKKKIRANLRKIAKKDHK